MTSEEFLNGLAGERRAYAENLALQRDDAITRIEKMEAERADLLKAHADALAAKDAEKAEALKKAADEQAVISLALQEQLVAKDATHAEALAKLAADKDAAASAAAAALQEKVAALQVRIAGTKGDYKVITTATQEVALGLEAAATGTAPATHLSDLISTTLYGIAKKREADIFALALAKVPSLPEETRNGLLAILGLAEFAVLPLPGLLKALEGNALPAFSRLPPAVQEQVIGSLGLSAGQAPKVWTPDPPADPTDDLGNDGDSWINTATGNIFLKANGTWK